MAFFLTSTHKPVANWSTVLLGGLDCYDTLDDDSFDLDRDEALNMRSALELVCDQLSDIQREELTRVDAHWRANPRDFNRAFARFHRYVDKTVALTGYVQDEHGTVPPIPDDHWWWRPIGE